MAQKNIDLGTFPDDPDADAIRTAFQKAQDNFTDLYQIAHSSGVASVTAGHGLKERNNRLTGDIILDSILPNVTIQTGTSIVTGINQANISNTATIADSKLKFWIDVSDTITTANAILANVSTGNLSITGNVTGNLTTTGTYNLGSSSNSWNSVFANNITVTANITAGNVSGGNTVSANYFTGTLTTHAQPNITSVGTLVNVTVSGNAIVGNLITNGYVNAVGDVSGATVFATEKIVSSGNIEIDGYLVSDTPLIMLAGGTGSGGDNYIQLQWAENINEPDTGKNQYVWADGDGVHINTSNYSIGYDNRWWFKNDGNFDAGGCLNVENILTSRSLEVDNTIVAGGYIAANALLTSGPVTALGNISGSNLSTGGRITATGNISGANIIASANISSTNINASGNLSVRDISSSGNLTVSKITASGNLSAANTTVNGSLEVTGNVTAANIIATGSLIVNELKSDGDLTANGMISGIGLQLTADISAGGYLAVTRDIQAGNLTLNTNANIAGNIITSSITGTRLSISGNIAGANLSSGNDITASRNIRGLNVTALGTLTGNTLSVSGDISVANISSSGNLTVSRITASGDVYGNSFSATGNISGNNITGTLFIGSGARLTNIPGANIVGAIGNANYSTYSSIATSAGIAATVTASAQPAITSVGTLSNVTVTGNVSAGNVSVTGLIASSVDNGITASGTTQSTGRQLTKQFNMIGTSVWGTADSVVLPRIAVGYNIIIMNLSSAAIRVFPASGQGIEGQLTDAAYIMSAGFRKQFIAMAPGVWYVM